LFLDLISSPFFLLAITGGVLLIGGIHRKSLIKFGLILISAAIGGVILESIGAFVGIPSFALLPILLMLWVAAIAIFAIFKGIK